MADTSLIICSEAKRNARWPRGSIPRRRLPRRAAASHSLVPVSLVGSFQHHRTGHWMIWPTKVTVLLHDTIETKGLTKEDVAALRERVREIIAAPAEEALEAGLPQRDRGFEWSREVETRSLGSEGSPGRRYCPQIWLTITPPSPCFL